MPCEEYDNDMKGVSGMRVHLVYSLILFRITSLFYTWVFTFSFINAPVCF